ncbi:MAG: enoyl-CoA hydratase/isomerase family protein [Brachymonas sp.]|nr:enoyl-CoA hydratase/isomerase family protein [Brachymonas sp.]
MESLPEHAGHIQLEVEGRVAKLTICHSARRNAMTRGMWRQLHGIRAQLPASVRCLLIQGEGEHFCAGGDISEYPSFRFEEATLAHFHEEEVAPALDALLALDMPVIAAIAGHCTGGGLEIACCADIRLARVDASFGAPIAKLGMPMAPRELELVARVAGESVVREMLLLASSYSASQMHARGFLHRVIDQESWQSTLQQTVDHLCQLSPQAARLNKQAFRHIFKQNRPLAGIECAQNAMNLVVPEQTQASPYRYASSAEHREGIEAFLQKRPANF